MKEYQKAVKLDQENYKAFSELGYGLVKKKARQEKQSEPITSHYALTPDITWHGDIVGRRL